MPQTSPGSSVVTCPYCGYPYPMSDMQREVYAGRNMGCMNCGRPFKVEAPRVVEPEPPAGTAGSAAALDGAAAAAHQAQDIAPSFGTPASSVAPKAGLRPNPPATIGFISALLFFVLIAAATVASAAAPDDNGPERSGLVPRTPAGILTALAIVSSSAAILFSAAGLVRTRRTAAAHTVRSAGRGMAVAGLSIGGGGLLITLIVLSTVVPLMSRQREMARRDLCKSNIQAISAALAIYANSNGARYPDSLSVLVSNGSLAPGALVCPSTSDAPAGGATPALQAAALAQPGHESYVYVAKGLTVTSALPKSTVLLYEPASNHVDVAHVLFLDGMIVPVPASFADPLRRELDTGQNPGPTAVSLHP